MGEANDYVGKGMAGGQISIMPPPESTFNPGESSLVGNTCLYGATGGRLFVNGRAGTDLHNIHRMVHLRTCCLSTAACTSLMLCNALGATAGRLDK